MLKIIPHVEAKNDVIDFYSRLNKISPELILVDCVTAANSSVDYFDVPFFSLNLLFQ